MDRDARADHIRTWMALTIVVRSGALDISPEITFDAPKIVLGRSPGCDLQLPDPSVSQRHSSILQRGSDYLVLDEGSSNGTFFGPVRLSPGAPRVVKHGDLIRLGRIWLELRVVAGLPTENPRLCTQEIALGLVTQALDGDEEPSVPKLVVCDGPDTDAELSLGLFGHSYIVGRSKTSDLRMTDPDCSRRHVELCRRGNHILVRELGSKNGASLNGEPLTAQHETVWKAGDPLVVGANTLRYEDPLAAALEELERAADEAISAKDAIEPPSSEEVAPAASSAGKPPPRSRQSANGPDHSPVAAPAVRVAGPQWTPTDYLVAAFALAILLTSLLGLFWVAGSP